MSSVSRLYRLQSMRLVAGLLSLFVLLASFAGCTADAGSATGTQTPGLDAPSKGYFRVLQMYLSPVNLDFDNQVFGCVNTHLDDAQFLQECQPGQTPFGSDAQTLGSHLSVTPPSRWESEDAAIKQMVQVEAPLAAQGAAAKTANDLSAIVAKEETAYAGACDAVNTINGDAIAAGTPTNELLVHVTHNYDSCTYLVQPTP
ncbi:MAG TPA: hypothetical protein VF120_07645 [Ktedonobacterales bacterium]